MVRVDLYWHLAVLKRGHAYTVTTYVRQVSLTNIFLGSDRAQRRAETSQVADWEVASGRATRKPWAKKKSVFPEM